MGRNARVFLLLAGLSLIAAAPSAEAPSSRNVSDGGVSVAAAGVSVLNVDPQAYIDFGHGAPKEAAAGQMGYQVHSSCLDIVGAGLEEPRCVKIWDNLQVTNRVETGSVIANGMDLVAEISDLRNYLFEESYFVSRDDLDFELGYLRGEIESLRTIVSSSVEMIDKINNQLWYLQSTVILKDQVCSSGVSGFEPSQASDSPLGAPRPGP